jgi:PhzF family phenazine biosynthesis protein
MSVAFTQVDAFTDEVFGGNPAAVVVLDRWPAAAWMASVAAEMNLSETAFLVRRDGGDAPATEWQLRWFTPAVEVDLCGHATLASAWVLWNAMAAQQAAAPALAFHTRSGVLRAARRDGWGELDFPATPPRSAEPPAGLDEALGVAPTWVGRSRFDVLALVDTEEEVRAADPDLGLLRQVEARGVILTARATEPSGGYDFVSRFFAPVAGVAEDPVTGSAHCALAPFWAERLGRAELVGYQASARGGFVRVSVAGDRVLLGGQAVLVARGELLVDPRFDAVA